MTIYEIKEELAALIDELQNNGGELTPELESALAVNETEMVDKLDSYCRVKTNLEAEVAAYSAEIDRLQSKMNVAQHSIDRIAEVIKSTMQLYERPKLETPLFKLSLRTNKSVNVIDEGAVPAEYIKTKTTTSVDKSTLRKVLMAGEAVAGVELKESQSLIIK